MYTRKLCVGKLCVDMVCVFKFCADMFYMSKFCVSKKCGDKVNVSNLLSGQIMYEIVVCRLSKF